MQETTFTLDLEEKIAPGSNRSRVEQITHDLLETLEAHSIRASVYVVGQLAQRFPDLVRRVHSGGHEVGLHSYSHTALTELTQTEFKEETLKGKAILENLTGEVVEGYRAPYLSLVRSSMWASDILAELGFTYSTSVLPTKSALFGLPGAPHTPYVWPSGVIEIPCATAGFGPVRIPVLGGVYLRGLPVPIVKILRKTFPKGSFAWTYHHPYEFDPDEPFWLMEPNWVQSKLLWMNRKRTKAKVMALMKAGIGRPLIERLPEPATLPIWPSQTGSSPNH